MKEIIMPQFGETTQEDITILKWLKLPGETVVAGEILLEVETEKSTLEVEAVDSGTLAKIVRKEGDTVKPGVVIGFINA